MQPVRLHASAVVWREDGILIRGPSGAGKTTLALAFAREGPRWGSFSRLVADDVVRVWASGGRLVARPHERIAGLAERRGIGVAEVPFEPACVLRLVVDLDERPPRLPSPEARAVTMLGITLPRLHLRRDAPALDNVYRALEFLAVFRARS